MKRSLKGIMVALFVVGKITQASAEAVEAPRAQIVPAESLTPVVLSNRSPNDLVCRGGKAIDHFVTKGMPIDIQKIPDNSGWMVSFRYQASTNGNRRYFSESMEAYFVCSNGKFKLTLNPTLTTSRTVWLGTGAERNINANLDLLRSQDIETFVADLGTQIINDNGNGDFLPPSYTIQRIKGRPNQWMKGIVDGVELRAMRRIKVDGTGVTAMEYEIRALQPIASLRHAHFIVTPLGANIFSVSLEDMKLRKGQVSTVVITHLDRGV